jgi:hypothetical protein
MNDEYSIRRLEKLIDARDFWREFEHGRWKLLSFTDKSSAKFGEMNQSNGQYVRYATINTAILKFIRGVRPDVIDNYEEIE